MILILAIPPIAAPVRGFVRGRCRPVRSTVQNLGEGCGEQERRRERRVKVVVVSVAGTESMWGEWEERR